MYVCMYTVYTFAATYCSSKHLLQTWTWHPKETIYRMRAIFTNPSITNSFFVLKNITTPPTKKILEKQGWKNQQPPDLFGALLQGTAWAKSLCVLPWKLTRRRSTAGLTVRIQRCWVDASHGSKKKRSMAYFRRDDHASLFFLRCL